ncbi:MucB/RseB C-terminal domain-containing protein [Colwelliaceae bacterium BS250]
MKFKTVIIILAFSSMPVFAQLQSAAKEANSGVASETAIKEVITPPKSDAETATTANPVKKIPTALQWMQRLSNSLRNLNFDTSFVVVRNNRAEPYRWVHGVENKKELELLTLLNGPRKETIRVDNTVSYFDSATLPYTVNANVITGPIPIAFSGNIEKLQQSYDFVGVGKSRILGRPAQLVRLESKDKQRFGYWLWLDIQSGLLLKAALISRDGELLEQIQFTHLSITEHPSELLKQLLNTKLPSPMSNDLSLINLPWSVSWLPQGFELVKSNRHTLNSIGEEVESLIYNDGLVDVSVYVSKTTAQNRAASVNQTGATVLLSQLRDGYEINVVGQIPAKTALAIAESVSFQ